MPRPEISHVVFDFDGTLSWLRHGWPRIMVSVFREHFPVRPDETETAIHDYLMSLIVALNGKPTIFQMIRFVEAAAERGVTGLDAESLRQEYQRRLDEAIARRSAKIRAGEVAADHYLLCGARPLLEQLRADGLKPMILSSTVQERVREEAELLGISHFFGPHIYGGVGDPLKFSKLAVFRHILETDGISGANLLSFGDGPVEIENTKSLGGIAVAICSDEDENGSGRLDPIKHELLLTAGADFSLPDFRDAPRLVNELRGRIQKTE